MSEWVSATEISAKMGYKILLAGLSEAGKTAVKRIFFLKQSTKEVDSLGATINYERMTMNIKDIPVTIVDLGGQKVFLKRFLSGFSPFVFSSVKIFVFLIDTANKSTRNSAIQYFISCLEKLDKFSPDAKIFVFLHKNDLVRHLPNYESIHEQLKEQFQLECPNVRLSFFRTTIYKPETVIDSFGRIFELAVPQIARSEFVDHREIGRIEEFAEKEMTIREEVQKVVQPQLGGTPQDMLPLTPIHQSNFRDSQSDFLSSASAKVAGDPKVLERLQSLMRQAIAETPSPNKETLSKDPLLDHPFLKDSIKEEIETEVEFQVEKYQPVEAIGSSVAIETKDDQPPEIIITEGEIDDRVNHLINFYGLENQQAAEIVLKGYNNLFESVAATSAIEISFIVDVFLKYLPLLKSKGVDIEKLDHERFFMIFFEIITGKLAKKDILKCIAFAIKKPEFSINEIIDMNFAKPVEVPIAEIKKDRISEEKVERPELAHIDISVETEKVDGLITIPDVKDLGFKIDLVDSNVQIEFHNLKQKKVHQRIIGRTIVSSTISVDEIIYLMAYELNMLSMGFFDKKKASIKFSAQIVHKSIQKLIEKDINTSKKFPPSVKFIIPVEVEIENDYLLLPGSDQVTFNLEKKNGKYLLEFRQRGFPIGTISVEKTDTLLTIRKILTEKMQLPIESEADVDFAARIIHAALGILIKVDQSLSGKKKKSDNEKEDEETTEKLKHFLDLLEK
ncbi:MAG: ADP-ribosylation factor-like protein [Candidatus Hodarchaeota archaeon]